MEDTVAEQVEAREDSDGRGGRLWLWPLAAVVGLMGAGFAVRVWGLGKYYYSPDGMLHLHIAMGHSLGEVYRLSSYQIHPPLMFFVLHYMTLISHNEIFLRGWSLAPGVGTIGAFYLLGRQVSGRAAGLVMAFCAAFGYGSVVLSDVIRHYSVILFFISLGLWAFISYLDLRRGRFLWIYGACLLIICSTHYSGAFPMAAAGLVWLVRTVYRREGIGEYGRMAATHLPTAVSLGLSLHHLLKIFESGYYGELTGTGGYMHRFFAGSAAELWSNFTDLFGYLFLPPVGPWAVLVWVAGMVVLFRKRREAAALVAVIFIMAVALNLTSLYPFGGTRHCIYIFPFAALAVGAMGQFVFDLMQRKVTIKYPSVSRQKLARASVVGLLVCTIAAAGLAGWSDYYHNNSYNYEFPVQRAAYQQTMEHLFNEVRPGDVVLTNLQTSFYLIVATNGVMETLKDKLRVVRYQDFEIFYYMSWNYDTMEMYDKALEQLRRQAGLDQASRLWLLNVGWGGKGFPDDLPRQTIFEQGGAYLYRIDGAENFWGKVPPPAE